MDSPSTFARPTQKTIFPKKTSSSYLKKQQLFKWKNFLHLSERTDFPPKEKISHTHSKNVSNFSNKKIFFFNQKNFLKLSEKLISYPCAKRWKKKQLNIFLYDVFWKRHIYFLLKETNKSAKQKNLSVFIWEVVQFFHTLHYFSILN